MLSPQIKRNISRILPFGLIWFFFSLIYILLEKGLLGGLHFYPSTGNPYNFTRNLLVTIFPAFLTGLLLGWLEIRFFNRWFIHKPFTQKIIFKSVIILAIIIAFLVTLTVIANCRQLHAGVFSKAVWTNVWSFFSDYVFLSVIFYIASIIVVSLFYSEMSDSIGQSVLISFFTGKYHRPSEEERIFMFLDMKSSTTFAEKLGHVRYFEILREYYSDISQPIIDYSGEIYQYVGDEIIVSWKLNKGIQNNHCVECFFAMKQSLKNQSAKYEQRYGLVPEFKAGLHFGKVTTGEIGVIKKEIMFTGDVLNTTARIQALCNSYNAELLISGPLLKLLDLSTYRISSLGEAELRGKDEKIDLFSINSN